MARMAVVLPAPLGPSTTVIGTSGTRMFRSRSASVLAEAVPDGRKLDHRGPRRGSGGSGRAVRRNGCVRHRSARRHRSTFIGTDARRLKHSEVRTEASPTGGPGSADIHHRPRNRRYDRTCVRSGCGSRPVPLRLLRARRRPSKEQGRGARSPAHRAGTDRSQRLAELTADVRALLEEFDPDAVAIERVLFQVNVARRWASVRPRASSWPRRPGVGWTWRSTPRTRSRAPWPGTAGADKAQVQKMVQILLGLAEPAPTGGCRRRRGGRAHPRRDTGGVVRTGASRMIGSLRGELRWTDTDTELLVEVGGVGYRVQVTPATAVG